MSINAGIMFVLFIITSLQMGCYISLLNIEFEIKHRR